MARFKYVEYLVPPSPADPTPRVYRPIIPITFRGPGGEVRSEGLVDTGASVTLLPLAIWGQDYPGIRW